MRHTTPWEQSGAIQPLNEVKTTMEPQSLHYEQLIYKVSTTHSRRTATMRIPAWTPTRPHPSAKRRREPYTACKKYQVPRLRSRGRSNKRPRPLLATHEHADNKGEEGQPHLDQQWFPTRDSFTSSMLCAVHTYDMSMHRLTRNLSIG